MTGPQDAAMTTISAGVPAERLAVPASWRLLAPLAALHAAMFVYDLLHPERFLNADRARERIEVLRGFSQALHSGDVTAYLASHGIVGDWLPQALLYLVGGQYFVIAAQIVLALFSVLWVLQLGRHLGLDERSARAAAFLSALLPHALVYPHQLASEAIFVPLVILGFRLASGPGSGLALGLATLVRPITALWPLIHVFARRDRAAFLGLAFAPLLLWMSFIFVATGELSMGRSGHDLGNNLYYRLQRMGADVPAAERPPQRPAGQTKATVREYLAFVAAHPLVTAKYAARDLAVMTFKSGIERIVLDYLDLYPEAREQLQAADGGWRSQVVDRGGVRAFVELVRSQPGLVGSAAAAALAFTLLMLLAAYGALRWAGTGPRRAERLALVAFVLYIFITSQAADAAQSRLRACAEFAICLLAVAGWTALRRHAGRHGG